MAKLLHAVIERDLSTGILVGAVPGLAGAHTQGRTVEEVRENLQDVLRLLDAQGAIRFQSEFVATTVVTVP